MSDIRIADTDKLLRMCTEAERYDLNRQLDTGAVAKDADPKGQHVVSRILPFHNRGITGDVLHHRVEVLVKVQGKDEPVRTVLDVLDETYESLQVAEARHA